MKIEIVNVGTELLLGEIINTNATDLQKICKEYGHEVYYQTVVGDNVERIEECFRLAFQRGADCIITTGGIGPTEDDLTKEISAKVLGLEMVFNQEEADKITAKCSFVGNSSHVAKANYKQAYFPKNCIIIDNRIGTANGCVMYNDQNQRIINLPGPPKEIRWCISHFLADYLKQFALPQIYTKDITCMGLGESNMADMLREIVDSQSDVTIAIYAHEDFNRVRLGYKCYTREEAEKAFEPFERKIKAVLAPYLIDLKEIKNKVAACEFKVICNVDLDFSFLNINDQSNDIIKITVTRKDLGDHVEISYKDHFFETNLLEDVKLNQPKLQSNILNHLYQWIYM